MVNEMNSPPESLIFLKGKAFQAISEYDKVLEIADELGANGDFNYYSEMLKALAYSRKGEYERSIEHSNRLIEDLNKDEEPERYAACLNIKVINYMDIGDLDLAL